MIQTQFSAVRTVWALLLGLSPLWLGACHREPRADDIASGEPSQATPAPPRSNHVTDTARAANPHAPGRQPAAAAPLDWRTLEARMLTDHVQLTFPEKFSRAGEQYLSPDGTHIIFQAIERPTEGADPSPHYAMYVARLKWEVGADGINRLKGMEEPVMVSAPGSANTCGFFHPKRPLEIIFGSTIVPPGADDVAGYQRGTRSYKWAFPKEMEICRTTGIYTTGDPQELGFRPAQPRFTNPGAYDAECAFSPDGRFIVHASVVSEPDDPNTNLDLFVFDAITGERTKIVEAPGYDGGPFFSPDGNRICYRSDRAGNDLLQVYVADIVFGERGRITGIANERAVTANEHVNWGPFWHPSGEFLVYATSEVSHSNYEVFAVEAPAPGSGTVKGPGELAKRRITHADGFDGLPVFSADGQWMIWTSQRGGVIEGEQRPSSQVWAARVLDVKPVTSAP